MWDEFNSVNWEMVSALVALGGGMTWALGWVWKRIRPPQPKPTKDMKPAPAKRLVELEKADGIVSNIHRLAVLACAAPAPKKRAPRAAAKPSVTAADRDFIRRMADQLTAALDKPDAFQALVAELGANRKKIGKPALVEIAKLFMGFDGRYEKLSVDKILGRLSERMRSDALNRSRDRIIQNIAV